MGTKNVPGCTECARFSVNSCINGFVFGLEFFESEHEIMEKMWADDVMKCAAGDFVELVDNGKVVRRFEGNRFIAPVSVLVVREKGSFPDV